MTKRLLVKDGTTWKEVSSVFVNTKNLSYTGSPHCMFDFETMDGGKPEDISGNNIPPASITWSGSTQSASETSRGNIGDFTSSTSSTSRLTVEGTYGAVNMANTDCTFSAWVFLSSGWGNQYRKIFMLYNLGLQLRLKNYNIPELSVRNTSGTEYKASSTALSYGEWISVIITWDYSSKTAKLYINGIDKLTVTLSGTPRNCTAIVYSWVAEALGGYMDDCRFYKNIYSINGTNTSGRMIEHLMNGRSVWEEVDNLYVNDAGTWKKSHDCPYDGDPFVDMTFTIHDGNGITNGDHYWNESIQDHTRFTLAKNSSSMTRTYRGGDTAQGYVLKSVSGGTFSVVSSTFSSSIDLNTTDCSISLWVSPLNFNGVQRLITLIDEALVLRFQNNKIHCFMKNTAGSANGFESVTQSLEWKFLLLNWNHNTNQMTCYKATGSNRSSMTVTNMGNATLSGTARSSNSLYISSNGSESLEGSIIMPRVHRRQIPQSEIPYLARET